MRIKIINDFERLEQVKSDEQRRITASAARKPFGKLFYALARPQLIPWKGYPVALKMLIMYLAAREYFVDAEIPKIPVELAADTFGSVNSKPLKTKLRDSILYVGAAWHMRFVRTFRLLVDEFKANRNVEYYGCGSGIIGTLALIASENRTVKLTLVDNDPASIDLAQKLIMLYSEHGYDINSQIDLSVDCIRKREPSFDTNTIVSIGLLHNYFSLDDANAMLRKWHSGNVDKVISDIYYDAEHSDDSSNDAKLRLLYVKIVCSWKIGFPNGLQFCDKEDFYKSLPEYNIDIYDHSLNATLVVTKIDK